MPRSQCFAEKRGSSWRGRYPDADGRMRSTSGYPTKAKALKAARDERAKIESGTWQDPQKGEIALADVHVHWSGVWVTCSVVTVSSWVGVSA